MQTQMPYNDQLWDKVNMLCRSKTINDLMGAFTCWSINRGIVGNSEMEINLPFELFLLRKIPPVMWQVGKTCSWN